MIEPIRDLLDSIQSDRGDIDERWRKALHYEVMTSQVEIYAMLLEKEMTLAQILDLQPGDIIPVEIPSQATLYAEEIPLFYGRVGIINGRYGIKIEKKAERGPDLKPAALVIEHEQAEGEIDE